MPDIDTSEKRGAIGTDRLLKPNDIVIDEITVTSYTGFTMNVRGQLRGLTIYEDVYANTLTAQLVLSDALAMMKHFPVVGNETVKVSFYTPGDIQGNRPIVLEFKCFNVSAMTKTTAANSRFIVMELASKEHLTGSTNRFSRSFVALTFSEIAKKIMAEQVVGEDKIDMRVYPTIGKKNLVIPYWTPFYAINWMAQKSVSEADFTHCDYHFYQTINGFYHFLPLSALKSLPPVAKYAHVPADRRLDTGDLPVEDYLRNIRSFSVVSTHNRAKSAGTGVYASSMITFDISSKSFRRYEYDYKSEFPAETTVSEYPIISFPNEETKRYANSIIKYYPKHGFQYDSFLVNDNVEQYAMRRQSSVNRMNTQILRLEVPGDSRIHVGDIVDVEIPAFEETLNKGEWKDTILSGKYMVTAIRHVLIDDDYTMEMVVAKDSYDYQLPDIKKQVLEAL
jgi:hypothetical protein